MRHKTNSYTEIHSIVYIYAVDDQFFDRHIFKTKKVSLGKWKAMIDIFA